MAVTTNDVLLDNAATWGGTPAIGTKQTELTASLADIDALAQRQGTDTTGYAAAKDQRKETMADKCMAVAKPLAAHFRILGNLPKLEMVDIERTDIIGAKATDAQDICELIHDEADDIIGALGGVGVTPAMVTELRDAIDAFVASIPKPRAAITETEAVTTAIAEEFGKLDIILTTLDELMRPFKFTHKEFFDNYTNARKIVDTGVRKISLIVKLLDSELETVVAGAEVALPEISEQLISTRTGNARFFTLPPGNFILEISHPLYQPMTVPAVGIVDGETTRLTLLMDKRT